MTVYTCQKCSAEAKVINGVPVKQCGCVAGMTAHLKATATGKSKVC